MKRKTTNTEKETHEHPELMLVRMMTSRTPIEDQEADGQKDFLESEQLPIRKDRNDNAIPIYHKLGIKTFPRSKDDDLFIGVKLPAGWKKEGTDHSMWNKLLDDRGRERAGIFYKAAFYDRSSHIHFYTRYYQITQFPDGSGDGKKIYESVIDRGQGRDEIIIFKTEFYDYGDYKLGEQLAKQCKDFLNEKYPDWENIFAYW